MYTACPSLFSPTCRPFYPYLRYALAATTVIFVHSAKGLLNGLLPKEMTGDTKLVLLPAIATYATLAGVRDRATPLSASRLRRHLLINGVILIAFCYSPMQNGLFWLYSRCFSTDTVTQQNLAMRLSAPMWWYAHHPRA